MRTPHPFKEIPEHKIAQFHAGYVPDAQTGCWIWKRTVMQKGYGLMPIWGTHYRAHRISYFIHYGVDPKELLVCHSCDNPPCVNPRHLWLGTNSDNITDMHAKRRVRDGLPPRATKSPCRSRIPEHCARCGHHRTDDYRFKNSHGYSCRRCLNCRRIKNANQSIKMRAAKGGAA